MADQTSDVPRFVAWSVVVVVLLIGLSLFIWLYFGGGVWRGEVRILEAVLVAPDRVQLGVGSCNGHPEVSVRETEEHVLVRAVASSTPLLGGDACADVVEFLLEEPLGDRPVIDASSGEPIEVVGP